MSDLPAPPRPAGDAPFRIRAALERMEEIRRRLDAEDVDLEEQLVLYREGVELAALTQRALDAAVAEVTLLDPST
jgi:exodeoxyribonuclease VII small subunit